MNSNGSVNFGFSFVNFLSLIIFSGLAALSSAGADAAAALAGAAAAAGLAGLAGRAFAFLFLFFSASARLVELCAWVAFAALLISASAKWCLLSVLTYSPI